MRFYDEATITVESGKWWDGVATWRREAGVPFGGPSWWNGGNGGAIIFEASKDENTLVAYKFRQNFKTDPWEPGRSRDQYWANAEDMILKVPVGTLIRDKETGKIFHIFSEDKERYQMLVWWEGGIGNIQFKDSVNQFPNFYLLGEPGQKKILLLELQLLADVALIGAPSVGKSSIINTISHTKAKVAEYPFTTLVPNLGSVHHKEKTFNVIDIPWLIKWAAEGKWLGNAFLRHILKTRIFAFVVDVARYDKGISEIHELFGEIWVYVQDKFSPDKIAIKKDGKYILFYAEKDGEIILEKRMIFLINKYDLLQDEEILQEYKKVLFADILSFLKKQKTLWKVDEVLLEKNTVVMSAVTHFGVDAFLDKVIDVFHGLKMEEVYHITEEWRNKNEEWKKVTGHKLQASEIDNMFQNVTTTDKDFLIEHQYMDPLVLKHANIWSVRHSDICKIVWMTPWWNDEAEHWFWKEMGRRGFLDLFDQAWIKKWDILKIVSYYEGKEDRYLLY